MRLSWNLGALTSWNSQGLHRDYFFTLLWIPIETCYLLTVLSQHTSLTRAAFESASWSKVAIRPGFSGTVLEIRLWPLTNLIPIFPPFYFLKFYSVIIIIIIIFLHGSGGLTCSGIDALPSFPRSSTISSSWRFVVEGVFRESGVVHSFKMVYSVLFVFGSYFLYSRDLYFFSYDFASLFSLSDNILYNWDLKNLIRDLLDDEMAFSGKQ